MARAKSSLSAVSSAVSSFDGGRSLSLGSRTVYPHSLATRASFLDCLTQQATLLFTNRLLQETASLHEFIRISRPVYNISTGQRKRRFE